MAHMTPIRCSIHQRKDHGPDMDRKHPSTHGVLRLLLEIDGETIVRMLPDIGFLHTGIGEDLRSQVLPANRPADSTVLTTLPMLTTSAM